MLLKEKKSISVHNEVKLTITNRQSRKKEEESPTPLNPKVKKPKKKINLPRK